MVNVDWLQKKIMNWNGPFSLIFRKRKRPSLVVVETKHDITLLPDAEKKLYDALCHCNYYVTPNKRMGKHSINFALVPFRIAIIKESLLTKRFRKRLLRSNWNIVSYNEQELYEDFYEVIRKINRTASSFLSDAE